MSQSGSFDCCSFRHVPAEVVVTSLVIRATSGGQRNDRASVTNEATTVVHAWFRFRTAGLKTTRTADSCSLAQRLGGNHVAPWIQYHHTKTLLTALFLNGVHTYNLSTKSFLEPPKKL